ncbi:FAD-dependent oxidoreductase [Sphingomonas quercus]|uniref:GMC family oxidoreductase n=1 Tax=Sphingomonas quercus TaxID=2842451 RepID=A0ABS6BKI2_9SPHN|nr:GMC family oxidoreductase [Sphingomonas quercus]MBU3078812.1 GMC family oxidoreductase [Sphingomonas quercus]
MYLDLDKGSPARLSGDVAVIGAGVAGITLARRLLAQGLHVVLLESGGRDFEAATAALNAGEVTGQDYYPLDHARLRFFGGTTAIWGGRCAELDPIDFERRPWVAHSGWPIAHADLKNHYAEAWATFDLPGAPQPELLRDAGVPLPRFAEGELATPLWAFDDQFDRFTFDRCRDVLDHPHCIVVTHATVREIVAERSGRGVARLDVTSIGGRRLTVVADDYVLAAGGLENPRLLLASRSVMPQGLGNGHDQVGRYFMEHPHARGGRIVHGRVWALLSAFAKRRIGAQTVAPLIAPGSELQRRLGLLNTSLTLAPRRAASDSEAWAMRLYLRAKHDASPTRFGRGLWKATKRTVGWLQQHTDPLRPWLLNRLGRLEVALVVRGEQAPNPDSRVYLSQERDPLGMPRLALDWRTSALDAASVEGLVAALGRETARLGLGKVEPAEWLSDPSRAWRTDALISAHPIGGYHHMGTTRMSASPRHGVADGYGLVHGLGNLYIAGSSLFPTSGWANPTLTIVALAMRTADRIIAQRSKSISMTSVPIAKAS